jgi:hypothetical protein
MVTNTRTLKAMATKGLIEWQPGIERHWSGLPVRRLHVQPGPKLTNWYDTFKYRGKEYRLRYVDGCFHPFVFATDARPPAFV